MNINKGVQLLANSSGVIRRNLLFFFTCSAFFRIRSSNLCGKRFSKFFLIKT
ncbi:Uncharacterised protein [Klebsiella pneumoniae]|nr:Uncharacterised protein [Klebsiella pneumoniae]